MKYTIPLYSLRGCVGISHTVILASLCILYVAKKWTAEMILETSSAIRSGNMDPRYSTTYEEWHITCQNQNTVLDRTSGWHITDWASTPWSLTPASFSSAPDHERCSSLPNLLNAVKYGQRVWPREPRSNAFERMIPLSSEYERRPSHFVPYGCSIEYMDAENACNILNRYSHVILAGDSLGRHAAQAITMLLTQDLVLGAFPRTSDKPSQILQYCRCDGQFSEHHVCRAYDQTLLHGDPRHYGVCSHLNDSTIFSMRYAFIVPKRDGGDVWSTVCSGSVERGKPVLVIINGGAHYKSNAGRTIDRLIRAVHGRIEAAKASCPNRSLDVKMVWTGLNAQSRRLDQPYPHQSREHAQAFNEIVDGRVAAEFGMVPVNFWNLTRDAMTSDGHHYLSDVNLFKANVFLHVARLLLEKRK